MISNIIFVLAVTFILGLIMGWVIWGRLKKRMALLENDWRKRFINLDDDYQSLVKEFSEIEHVLKDRIEHINILNEEKNDLTIKLNSTTNLNSDTANEIQELKSQLLKSNSHHRIVSKELDEAKNELKTFNNTPNEIKELKSLLGQATQRYNNNGLELKNKNEDIMSLKNQLESTSKHTSSLKQELDLLRTKLLKRDNEFDTQKTLFKKLQDELSSSETSLQAIREKLDLNTRASTTNNNQLKERDEKILILENQVKLVSKQYADTQQELVDAKNHIPALNNEINSLRKRVPSLEASLKQRDSSIAALENEVNRLANEFPPLHDEIETRKKQADDLEQQLSAVQQDIPNLKSTIAARDAHIRELEVFMKDAQTAILKPSNGNTVKNGNGNTENGATNGNVVNINGKSKPSNKETIVHANGSSKSNIVSNLNNKPKKNGSSKPVTTKGKTVATTTKPKIKPYGLKKPTRKPDDLKLISGIGETLEKTLHKCGIFYFEQIASFNLKDVNTVDQLLNFRGRIDRDDWIKQARALMRANKGTNKKTSHVTTKTPNTKRTTKRSNRKPRMKPLGMKRPTGELDDLQLINGVGPTLEKKLHRLGIYHYEQIAHLTAEDIALIDSKLKTYKGRVKRDKWPLQARKLHKEFYAGL